MPMNLESAKRHFEKLKSASAEWQAEFVKMQAFSRGEKEQQWDPEALAARKIARRAVKQYNFVPGFIRPTIAQIAQNPPESIVYPKSDGASEMQAKLYTGLLRGIQSHCRATRTYISTLELSMYATVAGWRVTPRKRNGKIDIDIEQIGDMSKVHIDPNSRLPDWSDAKSVAIDYEVTREEYLGKWPHGTAFEGVEEDELTQTVTIHELWVIETVHGAAADTSVDDDPSPDARLEPQDVFLEEETQRIVIYIFDDVSEKFLSMRTNYPCKRIPFVFVTGESYEINGKRKFTCPATDIVPCQQEYNWLKSEAITVAASAPKANFIAEEGSTDGYAEDWQTSATSPVNTLFFKRGAQMPKQVEAPPPPVGYMELADKAIDTARLITGIYPDPTQQATANQNADTPSGKAIKLQRAEANLATYHHIDSLHHALELNAQILVEMIREFWQDDDVRESINSDGSVSLVSVGPVDKPGVANLDPKLGEYGVRMSFGPAYGSAREDLIDRVSEIVSRNPGLFQILGPWLIQQWNVSGADEIAELLKYTWPPELRDFLLQMKGVSSDPSKAIDQLKLMCLQLQQQNKQLTDKLTETAQALQKETMELDDARRDRNIDVATRIQEAMIREDGETRRKAMAELHMDLREKEKLEGNLQTIRAKMDADADKTAIDSAIRLLQIYKPESVSLGGAESIAGSLGNF